MSLENRAFYQCIIKITDCLTTGSLKLEDYIDGLKLLYGEKTVENALDHIEGRKRFNNLVGSDLNMKSFTAHQELIRIYNILKEAQSSYND